LSRTGVFPLDRVVKIDPDHFKSAMPEWNAYTKFDNDNNTITSGNNTHKESGFIQELCQAVSLRLRQNTWIDGSLQDHHWWSKWINDIRQEYPWYRIAIFYVHASEEQVLARAKKRGEVTGRYIEEKKLLESITKTAEAIEVLGPLADFVARIDNSGPGLPKLEVFEDRSHSFRAISDRFRSRIDRTLRFPESLGTMWLRPVDPFVLVTTIPKGMEDVFDALTNKGMTLLPLSFMLRRKENFLSNDENDETKTTSSLDLAWMHVVPMDAALSVTEISRTTLDDHSRSIAGIPASADWFGWTHGLTDSTLRKEITTTYDVDSNSILQLLCYGGYLYFEQQKRIVVAVNAVCPQAGSVEGAGNNNKSSGEREGWTFRIEFESAQRLPVMFEQKMMENRWVDCVNPLLLKEGCVQTAWLLPGELATLPGGGFGFRMKESSTLYFAVDAS